MSTSSPFPAAPTPATPLRTPRRSTGGSPTRSLPPSIRRLSSGKNEEALRAGASGYLLKDIPAQDLARAVQALHKGIYQLDPAVAGKLVSALGGSSSLISAETSAKSPTQSVRDAEIPPSELTAREIEVLRLIAQGATNREIATQLVISEGTVKNHISHMLSRLGLRDRTQAAIYAREHGLL